MASYQDTLNLNREYWRQYENAPISQNGVIFVDCCHDSRYYVHRNLVIAKFISLIKRQEIIAFTGMPFNFTENQEEWKNRHLDLIASFGIEKTINLPSLNEISNHFNEEIYQNLLDYVGFVKDEKLDVKKREKLSNFIDKNGNPIGRFAFDTYVRSNLDANLKFDAQFEYWVKYSICFFFYVEKLYSKFAKVDFVLGHIDYMPWGILGEIALRKNGNVIYQRTDLKANISILNGVLDGEKTLSSLLANAETKAFNNFTQSIKNNYEEFVQLATLQRNIQIEKKIGYDPRGMATNLGESQGGQYWKNLYFSNENPIAVLFMHTLTDISQSDKSVFVDYLDWALSTLDFFSKRSDLNLLVKKHPLSAQYDKNSDIEKLYVDYSKFPNIKFFDDGPSRADLAQLAKIGLSVRGSPAVEMATYGMRMMVCGASNFSQIGFCDVTNSKEEYFQYLDDLAQKTPLEQGKIERAMLYYAFSSNWVRPTSQLLISFGMYHTDAGYEDKMREAFFTHRLNEDDCFKAIKTALENGGGKVVSNFATNLID